MAESAIALVMGHLDVVLGFVAGTLVQRYGVMGLFGAVRGHIADVVSGPTKP